MIRDQFTKAQKREIRRLVGLAHERELSTAAEELLREFECWRRGGIDVFVLNEQIHKFHNGISRVLYNRYVGGELEWSVVGAIARGVVKESEIDPVALQGLRKMIDWAGQMKAENEVAARRAEDEPEGD
jgi:hypothetical protein